MDVYSPAFDNETQRPLIFYVHGGGFSGGTRNEPGIQAFCKKLARHGYVVSSISYRLTRAGKESGFGCDCPAVDKRNTFNDAVEDLQDATFFMIQQRDKMGIDPQKIILSGSSAGAETVLNTAYQPPYCYGLDSGPVFVFRRYFDGRRDSRYFTDFQRISNPITTFSRNLRQLGSLCYSATSALQRRPARIPHFARFVLHC